MSEGRNSFCFLSSASESFDLSSEAVRRRRHRSPSCDSAEEGITNADFSKAAVDKEKEGHWRRILLLIVAITLHNIPEGLAVGVGFGAAGRSASATFESARYEHSLREEIIY